MKSKLLENLVARFDAMNIRERGLISFALLAAIVMLWDLAFMQPLNARRVANAAELESLQKSISTSAAAAEASAASDPMSHALTRQRAVQTSLDAVNVELASASAGLIPPERMVEVIHDVLGKQRNLKLVTLHNEPVASLIKIEEGGVETGPYIHPVELVVEGRYLDVLEYMRALEALPWNFRWKILELETVDYPINRVRVELSTLSMDKEWLGV
jgi:MSHA biogenesis protein MshJ